MHATYGFSVIRPEMSVQFIAAPPPTAIERVTDWLQMAARTVVILAVIGAGTAAAIINPNAFMRGFAVGFIGTSIMMHR